VALADVDVNISINVFPVAVGDGFAVKLLVVRKRIVPYILVTVQTMSLTLPIKYFLTGIILQNSYTYILK